MAGLPNPSRPRGGRGEVRQEVGFGNLMQGGGDEVAEPNKRCESLVSGNVSRAD